MAKGKGLKWKRDGFQEIRLAPGVQDFTREIADKVAAAAGPGFVVKRSPGRNRARYVVVPTTPEAYRANHQNLAVLQALGKI